MNKKILTTITIFLMAISAYSQTDYRILAVNTNPSASEYNYLNYSNAIKSHKDQLTIAPEDDELAKASWVRSLNMQGAQWFFTQSVTNGFGEKTTNFVSLSTTQYALFTNTIASPVTATTYLAGGITTQKYSVLRAPVTFEVWINRTGGAANSIVNAHPEIYYVYNGTTNQLGDYEAGYQNIAESTTPKKYTWTISFEQPVITGLVSIVGYLKTDTVSGPACGLNIYGGGSYDSHMDITGTREGESASEIITQVESLLNTTYSVTSTFVVSNTLDFAVPLQKNRVSLDDVRFYLSTTNNAPFSKRASIQLYRNSNRRCDKMVYLDTNQLYWVALNTTATSASSGSNTVADASGVVLNDLYYIKDNDTVNEFLRPTNTTSTIIYWGCTNLNAYTTTSLVSHVNQFGGFKYYDELNTSQMWFRLTFTTPYTTTVQTVINYGR